ncbi:MAG: hypothetical protein IPP25_18200 [Saprospiraceae bacterium]|nr:hypothetical protein [Candidatus Opimibacter skivensis]
MVTTRNIGCSIMILPAIAFIFMMIKFKDVGPIEGTTMWIIFFLGFWLSRIKSDNAQSYSNPTTKTSIENPIKSIFGDLNTNQKMSRINMWIATGVGEEFKGSVRDKRNYLNQYIEYLNVHATKSTEYFKIGGIENMINDLNQLSQKQKELLAVIAWGMITCDGPPTDLELEITGNIFNQLGIEEEQFGAIVYKSIQVSKRFGS